MTENIWISKARQDARNLFEWGFAPQEIALRVYTRYTNIYMINERFTWTELCAVKSMLEGLMQVEIEI